MSVQQRAIRAATWTAVQNWGDQLFGFVVFMVLARLLNPESFGLVAYATAFIGFTQVLVRGGMGAAIVQRESIEPEHLDAAFWYSIGLALVLATVLAASAESVAGMLGEAQLADLLRVLSPLLIVQGLTEVHAAVLRRGLHFRELAIRLLIANSVGGAAGLIAAFQGFGMWSLVVQHLVNGLLTVGLLWAQSDWRPRLQFSTRHFRELSAFGGPFTLTAMMWAVTGRADRLLIGRMLGPAALGYYAVGSKGMRMILQLVANMLTKVGLPVFSRLQNEPERLRRGYLKALRFSCLGLFPAYCGLGALSPSLVQLLFGQGWEETIPIIQVLALFGLSQAIQGFAAPVMNAMGKPMWVTAIATANGVLTVVGVWLAAPYGLTAVAWAITLRGYVMIPFVLGGVHRLLGLTVRDTARMLGAPLVASLVLGAFAYLVDRELTGWLDLALPRIAVIGVVSVVVYVLMIRLLVRELYDEAWSMLQQAIPARMRTRIPGLR